MLVHQCALPRPHGAVGGASFTFLRALCSCSVPRPANIAYTVESALAIFPSCCTVALAIVVHLSSSIKVCTTCSMPTTCSRMGARRRRSPLQALQQCPLIAGVQRRHFPCAIVGILAIVVCPTVSPFASSCGPQQGGGVRWSPFSCPFYQWTLVHVCVIEQHLGRSLTLPAKLGRSGACPFFLP